MNNFIIGNTEYQVTSAQPIDASLTALRGNLEAHGKDCIIYYASKVLKSGKASTKQGGMFYRFSESGNFIKAI